MVGSGRAVEGSGGEAERGKGAQKVDDADFDLHKVVHFVFLQMRTSDDPTPVCQECGFPDLL